MEQRVSLCVSMLMRLMIKAVRWRSKSFKSLNDNKAGKKVSEMSLLQYSTDDVNVDTMLRMLKSEPLQKRYSCMT